MRKDPFKAPETATPDANFSTWIRPTGWVRIGRGLPAEQGDDWQRVGPSGAQGYPTVVHTFSPRSPGARRVGSHPGDPVRVRIGSLLRTRNFAGVLDQVSGPQVLSAETIAQNIRTHSPIALDDHTPQ